MDPGKFFRVVRDDDRRGHGKSMELCGKILVSHTVRWIFST